MLQGAHEFPEDRLDLTNQFGGEGLLSPRCPHPAPRCSCKISLDAANFSLDARVTSAARANFFSYFKEYKGLQYNQSY